MSGFSRLGSYSKELLDTAAWAYLVHCSCPLVAYWAREVSMVAVRDWPLLRSGANKRG